MPKGHNKDGFKKVRPANSGHKLKSSVKISPQISSEAAVALARKKKDRTNLNKLISQAILEKAQNDAYKKSVLIRGNNETAPSQIDLVDLIEEIKFDKANKL